MTTNTPQPAPPVSPVPEGLVNHLHSRYPNVTESFCQVMAGICCDWLHEHGHLRESGQAPIPPNDPIWDQYEQALAEQRARRNAEEAGQADDGWVSVERISAAYGKARAGILNDDAIRILKQVPLWEDMSVFDREMLIRLCREVTLPQPPKGDADDEQVSTPEPTTSEPAEPYKQCRVELKVRGSYNRCRLHQGHLGGHNFPW